MLQSKNLLNNGIIIMDIQNQLYSIVNTARGAYPIEESLKLLVLVGAALSLDNKKTLEVLELGEVDAQEYLKQVAERYKIKELGILFENRNLKALEVFVSLNDIFKYLNKDTEKFGKVLMEFYVHILNEQRNLGNISENPSSAQLVAQLTKDWNKETLFDGAAGIGYVASLIDAQQSFLCDLYRSCKDMACLFFKMLGKDPTYTVFENERSGTLIESVESRNVDLVVTHPPYGIRLDDSAALNSQNYLVPDLLNQSIPSSASDSLWIQHGLYQLNDQGKMIIQMATGWLFRSGYDAKLRKYLIENRLISGVIFLPENLSPFTAIGTVLLILDKQKSSSIRFIDARDFGIKAKGQSFKTLSYKEIESITNAFREGSDNSKLCKDISFKEIRENDYNLSAASYFSQEVEVKSLDLVEEMNHLLKIEDDFLKSSSKFNEIIEKLMN